MALHPCWSAGVKSSARILPCTAAGRQVNAVVGAALKVEAAAIKSAFDSPAPAP
jgi:hypothetical protein